MDTYQNCYILNDQEGKTSALQWQPTEIKRRMLEDGRTLGNFTVHIMRPFNTVDMESGDLQLDKDTHIGLQLSVEWDKNIR